MKRVHVLSDRSPNNGMFVAAKLMADHAGDVIMTCTEFAVLRGVSAYDEVVVHGCWLPCYWKACWKVLRSRAAIGKPRLVRMTHANLDLVRYRFHGWKKRLVAPIERWIFRRTDRVLVTCAAEKGWCESWGLKNRIEIVDLKRFFGLDGVAPRIRSSYDALHVLYLGRLHMLKGTKYLEQAVKELNDHSTTTTSNYNYILRMVSDHHGEELERDWEWCDVLCLPTLSDNFGLVVAEALERGKRVITTDGAPAWEDQSGVVYLRGYRDGSDETRVEMLKGALRECLDSQSV